MAASEMSELWVKGRPAAMNVHDRAPEHGEGEPAP